MVITLCGSTKFKDEFLKAEKELRQDGNIVLTVEQFSHADNIPINKKEMEIFDHMHREKIKLSDMILVINQDDYIGESTKKEIEYAKSLNKHVEYRYPHKENKDNQQPSSINNREGSTTSQNDVGSSDSEKQDSYDDRKILFLRACELKELIELIGTSKPPDGMTKKEYGNKIRDILIKSHDFCCNIYYRRKI